MLRRTDEAGLFLVLSANRTLTYAERAFGQLALRQDFFADLDGGLGQECSVASDGANGADGGERGDH